MSYQFSINLRNSEVYSKSNTLKEQEMLDSNMTRIKINIRDLSKADQSVSEKYTESRNLTK